MTGSFLTQNQKVSSIARAGLVGRSVGKGRADKIRPTDPNFRPRVGEKVCLIFELKYYITSRIVDPCDRLLKEDLYK
jgi:hypothetical protein